MERDPVCGMYLLEVNNELKSNFEGQVYYFCCRSCKEAFDKNPLLYLYKEKVKTDEKEG